MYTLAVRHLLSTIDTINCFGNKKLVLALKSTHVTMANESTPEIIYNVIVQNIILTYYI
jgi:hypothetical protein